MFYIQNYTVHKCSVFSLWTHSICPHTFMSMSGVTAVMAAVMLPISKHVKLMISLFLTVHVWTSDDFF